MRQPVLPHYPKDPPPWWNENDSPYSWEEWCLVQRWEAEREAVAELKEYESEEDEDE